jgi:hypothetical protein
LQSFYPWSQTLEGWVRIWLGDLAETSASFWVALMRFTTVALTALAYLGLVRGWLISVRQVILSSGDGKARRQCALASGLFCLALLPLLVAIRDAQHPYQFYKLLLTVSPLLALGLALVGSYGLQPLATLSVQRPWLTICLPLPLMIVLVLGTVATAGMVLKSASAKPRPRSGADVLLVADMRRLQDLLEELPECNVLIGHPNAYHRSWLAYFARRHRVWLADSTIVDADLRNVPALAATLDLKNLPKELRIITQHKGAFAAVAAGDLPLAWAGDSYQLWQVTCLRSHWALPLRLINPNGLETVDQQPFFWMGGPPTQVDVLAGAPGTLKLHAVLQAGPSLPTNAACRLRITTTDGFEHELRVIGGPQTMIIPLPAGRSTISLQALQQPNEVVVGNDPRPMLIGVQGLEAMFEPAPAVISEAECPRGVGEPR